ncbi:hypothetical protein CRG98_027319 [Punica granatum]|uniref:Uncharacterized protein n=1 Tax=Punica granatum TaxID=22663 RepID=A0A2I0J7R1_PUNGR|nr:hypothetical protein CRG98_027319 [Punica granatum]
MDAYSDRAPGAHSTDKQTAPQNGPTGTQGPPGSGNKLQTTFRNSTRLSEGRFNGHERLPGFKPNLASPNLPIKLAYKFPSIINSNHFFNPTLSSQSPSKILSNSSPLPLIRPPHAKAKTGQNRRKTIGYSGLGTFGSAHGHLGPPLRSPTSPISHRAVSGASVLTPFFPSCRGCLPLGLLTRSHQTESCDSHGHFADSFPRTSGLGRGLRGFGCSKRTAATPLAMGAVRFLGPPDTLGLFLLEAV